MPKIRVSKRVRPPRDLKKNIGASIRQNKDSDAKADDGGFDHTRKYRFPNLSDLHAKWEKVKLKRGAMRSWENILKSYERKPWKDPQTGQVKPNFGRLRERVDQSKVAYIDFVTERDRWYRVVTDDGISEGQNQEWSDEISFGFQRYCIRPWQKKFHTVMLAVQDMLLYSKGALFWEQNHGCYPDSIAIEAVWPDEQADSLAESFDILFVQKKFTAVELFRKIDDDEVAETNGWNKTQVLRVLKHGSQLFSNSSLDDVFRRFREGNVNAEAENAEFKLVFAFCKEYRDHDEKPISQYCFLDGHVPQSGPDSKNEDPIGYLMQRDGYVDGFENIIGFLAYSVARNFYEDPSLAQLVYTTCKTYDIVMNRILEAIEDNMRVYLESDTTDQAKKLQTMRHGQFQVLGPDTKLAQSRIERPVQDANNVLRGLVIDMDAGTGRHIPHEQSRGKTPKTAQQAFSDSAEQAKIGGADMKIFNANMTIVGEEIYRRFTTQMTTVDVGYKRFQKFKKYLTGKGVPDSAWKPENIIIESVLNSSVGNVSAKIEGSQVVLATLSAPHGSQGELRAKRDIIAAVVGRENVDAYLSENGNFLIAEDSLIGLENDALSDASSDPANIPVTDEQMHLRHIPRHIEFMSVQIEKTAQLFSNVQNLIQDDIGVYLNTVMDLLVGIDNVGAHTTAHIQLATRAANPIQAQLINQSVSQLTQLQGQQDQLTAALEKVQGDRLQKGQEKRGADPEFNHKQAMFQLEEEHRAKSLAFDYREKQLKGEQLRVQSAANAQLKELLAVQAAEFDKQIAIIKAQIEQIKKQGSEDEKDNKPNGRGVFR